MANTKITSAVIADNAITSSKIDSTSTGITFADLIIDTDTLVVDSANNRVGIGTSSPSGKLHINSTNVNQITLQNANGGTNAERIGLSMEATDTFVIRSLNDNSTTRVDNILVANILTGKVSIGTDTAQAELHVVDSLTGNNSNITASSQTVGLFERNGDAEITILGNAANYTAINFSDDTHRRGQIKYVHGNGIDKMRFNTASTQQMVIDSSGNVGIGTDGPDAQLDIYGAGDSTRGLQITATAANGYAEAQFVADSREWRIGSGGSTGLFPNMFYIYDQQASSGRLLIDSATGDVRLVGGNQMTNALSWWNGTSYELASIENASHPSYNDSGGLVFKTAGTSQAGMAEAMRIDAQGFVGIGTTNPENKLHVMLPTGQNGDILRLSRSNGSYSFKVGVDGNSSYYVSNNSSTKIIDANYQGWVTHPQQPHIVFSPRYSGGSGYANYHHEDTTYSRGTLSSTTVAGYARVTVPAAGLYLVTFHSIGDREQNVRRDMIIAVNGGAVATALTEYDTDGFKYRCITITLELSANDYLTFSNDDWYDAGSGSVTTWRKVSITKVG